jgi:capsular exopolysaccharide synthesis family protein
MEEKRSAAIFENLPADAAAVHTMAVAPASGGMATPESVGHKLLRGKWLVLSTIIAFSLIAMMLGALETPLYKEQTSIEVQSPDVGVPKSNEADPAHPTESFLQTQIRIIESRSLLERVLGKLSDNDRARLLETPHFWWSHTSYDQSVEALRQHITARPSDQADIIDVSLLSADPNVGASFLNLLTRELADVNVERTWHAMQHNRQFAERQIDDLRRRWQQSEQVLAEYSQLSGLNQAAPVATAKGHVDSNDPKLRQLREHLADLQKQIAQWQALYGPSGATVLNLKSQAAQTEAAIRQHRLAVPQTAPVLGARKDSLPSSNSLAHMNELQQEAESNRAIYEASVSRLKESTMLAASQLGEISVVDPAIPVTRTNTPGKLITGTLGSIVGFLVGLAFVALRDRFSTTFSDPALLSQYLGLHVLGAIPVDRFSQGLTKSTTLDANPEPTLQINFDTDIHTAEAFRTIRSSILLGASQRSGPRRLVFTSAGASDGTTFVVGNLGAALASAQRRVLLVDGNLRTPGLHKIFGTDNDHGLADLLVRQIAEHPVQSRDVIRETQIPDLYLLTAGQAGARAPEILSSVQLPQLIREFAKGFDLVLVDSPPILPYADARSLARAVDAVVLIVKACATDRHLALQARDAITQDGAHLIGAIMTEWDAAQSATA